MWASQIVEFKKNLMLRKWVSIKQLRSNFVDICIFINKNDMIVENNCRIYYAQITFKERWPKKGIIAGYNEHFDK